MPEGDTIFRAARSLHKVLAGHVVTRFQTAYAHIERVNVDTPIVGRTIDKCESAGKHLLIRFSGDLILRTHMRMNGSWHIYRPGERWQRPRHEMRIVLATATYVAVAFAVPVAEFVDATVIEREGPVAELGPDVLSTTFDAAEAVARLQDRGDFEIADALLDQRALAGIGNVFKSEILFAARVSPFTPVHLLDAGALDRIVAIAQRQLRANVGEADTVAAAGGRRTTNRLDPSARLFVYGRRGLPCRRCGTPIQRAKQGPDARSTYWCERCQPRVL